MSSISGGAPSGQTEALHTEDRFVMRQKLRPVGNRYEFYLADEDGEASESPIALVDHKAFKLKEDIRFYLDESREDELMRIAARQVFDPAARYDVLDADGETIGSIQKEFQASLVRSTYRIHDSAGNELATATESSQVVAILRRAKSALDVIPILGNIAELFPVPYHFVFQRDGAVLGHHRRRLWKLRDTYDIDMTDDRDATVDRRLVLALAVGFDALQSR